MEQLLLNILECVKEGIVSVEKAHADIMKLYGQDKEIAKLEGIIEELGRVQNAI